MLGEYLLRLTPTGPSGFEGLLAKMLTELTGLNFRLAKSGFQAGRDLSSREFGGNVIAVEAKRYGSSTELDERELLGEIVQAVNETPDLDLWVLVTTRDVNAQLSERLTAACNLLDIEFLHISNSSEPLNRLTALCANSQNVVLDSLSGLIDSDQAKSLIHELQTLTNALEYESLLENMRQQLISPQIGFDSWRNRQNKWFLEQIRSEERSRVAFGQALNVADKSVQLIERLSAWQQYDQWWKSWEDHRKPIAILGEEGDGKTWSVAAWLEKQLRSEVLFPVTVFVTSGNVATVSPEQLITDEVFRR